MAMSTLPQSSSALSEKESPMLKRVTAIGCTNYPKESLSYRWVISNVKTLMSIRGELKGPHFTVSLPTESWGKKSLTWYLQLSSSAIREQVLPSLYSIYLCCSDSSHEDMVPKAKKTCLMPESKAKKTSPFSRYWITDCIFSVLDAKTNEVKLKKAFPNQECGAGKSVKCGGDLGFSNKLDEFISDGNLTLEVTASLSFLMDPTGISIEPNPVPPHNVLDGIKKLHGNKLFADITIKCGEMKFEAHKAILASQSPVICKMFETNMRERRNNTIEVTDIHPNVMSDLIAFIYTGSAPNLNTLAKGLLYAATKYEIPRLVVLCENELALNLHVSNVLETVQCADTYGAPNLKKACLRMMKCNSAEVFNSEGWKDFKASSDKDLAYEVLEFKD